MQIGSAVAIYFVLWWIVLFAVLPFGVRSQAEAGESVPGSDPGAPVAPLMLKKLIWTTIVSAVIFAIATYAYKSGYLNVDRINRMFGLPL
jgi:predicted secreted protein